MKTKIIPLEHWAELMEERAELLAFKCRVLEERLCPARPRNVGAVREQPLVEGNSSIEAMPPISDFAIRRLQNIIQNRIATSGLSRNKWAHVNRINKRDLSYLFNHFALLQQGRRSISAPKLAELIERYLTVQKATTLKTLHGRTLSFLQKSGLSQREFCALHGVSAPDLSCFLAMFNKDKKTSRKPSRKAVERLEEVLADTEATR